MHTVHCLSGFAWKWKRLSTKDDLHILVIIVEMWAHLRTLHSTTDDRPHDGGDEMTLHSSWKAVQRI